MGRRRAVTVLAFTVLAASAAVPASAAADGLPVPGGVDTTGQGVLGSTGAQRWLAVPQGGSTLVLRVATGSGQLLANRSIHGAYSVPGVAIDGDTSGISEDGSALVLVRPRVGFPQRETSMALLDPTTLEVERTYDLKGDFSFDAISPDGDTAFVVQYPDPREPTYYRLRTLDLGTGRLAPGSLLPENDPDEEMRGFPLARASGPGGRWQFTLYDGGVLYGAPGGHGEPFVHAIDTVAQRTLCIDLDWDLTPRELDRAQLQLSDDGEAIEVVDPGRRMLGTVGVETGEAMQADAASADPAESDDAVDEGSLWPAALIAPLVLLAIAGVGLIVRRSTAD